MSVVSHKGVVENGLIHLPEGARVFVVVPGAPASPQLRVMSPRLADPAPIADFAMEVTEG